MDFAIFTEILSIIVLYLALFTPQFILPPTNFTKFLVLIFKSLTINIINKYKKKDASASFSQGNRGARSILGWEN